MAPAAAAAARPLRRTRTAGCSGSICRSDPPTLLLILNRSGSMVEQVGGKEKWAETVAALDTVVSRTQAAVAWGLKLLPLPSQCSVPIGVTVPVVTSNHAAVMKSINDNRAVENGGSTPTREAVNKGFDALKATPSPNSNISAGHRRPAQLLPGGSSRSERSRRFGGGGGGSGQRRHPHLRGRDRHRRQHRARHPQRDGRQGRQAAQQRHPATTRW